jgi:hypothetical protein
MTADDAKRETPTVDEEVAAIRAVLEALLKIQSPDARLRVLMHARHYLGIAERY